MSESISERGAHGKKEEQIGKEGVSPVMLELNEPCLEDKRGRAFPTAGAP